MVKYPETKFCGSIEFPPVLLIRPLNQGLESSVAILRISALKLEVSPMGALSRVRNQPLGVLVLVRGSQKTKPPVL